MEKVELPKKTKVAVWWMMIIGGIIGVIGLIAIFSTSFFSRCPAGSECYGGLVIFMGFMLTLFSLFLFVLGYFIFQRKKWAWLITVILLGGITVGGIIYFIFPLFFFSIPLRIIYVPFSLLFLDGVIFGVPLLLLLLDRKNFWKIAT